MSIKISDFIPLNTPAGNDVLPILDVSEPNTANQNKKITVDNLLTLATGAAENPYIKVTYTEDVLPTTPDGNLIIGEDFNKYSNPPYTNRIPDGYNIVLGSSNNINAPNNNTEVSGEFPSPTVRIIGNNNTIGNGCSEASIFGHASIITNNGNGALILGTNSAIGQYPINPLAYNYYSTAIGDSVEIEGNGCIALGYTSKIYNNSTNSVAIGTGAKIGTTTATVPTDSAISIGDNSKVTNNYGIAIGVETSCAAKYGTAVGNYAEIDNGAEDAIALGSCYIPATGVNAIAIGLSANANGPQSIAIGNAASCNSTTDSSIAIGHQAAARSINSIVIGKNASVQATATNTITLGNNTSILAGSTNNLVFGNSARLLSNSSNYNIILGDNSLLQSNLSVNNIILGTNASISGTGAAHSNNIIIGDNSNLTTPITSIAHQGNVLIGSNAVLNSPTAITNSVQLGTGTISTSNTLQFLSQPIANSTSIQIATQTTNVAPTSTPPNGTLILDQTGNGKLWIRVNGTWKSTTLS